MKNTPLTSKSFTEPRTRSFVTVENTGYDGKKQHYIYDADANEKQISVDLYRTYESLKEQLENCNFGQVTCNCDGVILIITPVFDKPAENQSMLYAVKYYTIWCNINTSQIPEFKPPIRRQSLIDAAYLIFCFTQLKPEIIANYESYSNAYRFLHEHDFTQYDYNVANRIIADINKSDANDFMNFTQNKANSFEAKYAEAFDCTDEQARDRIKQLIKFQNHLATYKSAAQFLFEYVPKIKNGISELDANA